MRPHVMNHSTILPLCLNVDGASTLVRERMSFRRMLPTPPPAASEDRVERCTFVYCCKFPKVRKDSLAAPHLSTSPSPFGSLPLWLPPAIRLVKLCFSLWKPDIVGSLLGVPSVRSLLRLVEVCTRLCWPQYRPCNTV